MRALQPLVVIAVLGLLAAAAWRLGRSGDPQVLARDETLETIRRFEDGGSATPIIEALLPPYPGPVIDLAVRRELVLWSLRSKSAFLALVAGIAEDDRIIIW